MNTTTKQAAIETTINGSNLILNFANGKALAVSVGQLSQEIAHAAILHGLKQKLCDAGAIARDPETGRITGDAMGEFLQELFARLNEESPNS